MNYDDINFNKLTQPAELDPSHLIKEIISLNEQMVGFWKDSYGWAPVSAADLLGISRLDRLVSLSKSLFHWVKDENISDGDLILAWTNLGAVVEGSLKLFFSVYYEDYKNDDHAFKDHKTGKIINPAKLKMDKILQFLEKKDLLLDPDSRIFLRRYLQPRRNSIHAYEDKDIGTYHEFIEGLESYLLLLYDIQGSLPYPTINEIEYL